MATDGTAPPTAPPAASLPPATVDDKTPPGDEYEEIREQVRS